MAGGGRGTYSSWLLCSMPWARFPVEACCQRPCRSCRESSRATQKRAFPLYITINKVQNDDDVIQWGHGQGVVTFAGDASEAKFAGSQCKGGGREVIGTTDVIIALAMQFAELCVFVLLRA